MHPTSLPWARLKNPDALTANQQTAPGWIASNDPALFRAHPLKEALRLIVRLPHRQAVAALDESPRSSTDCPTLATCCGGWTSACACNRSVRRNNPLERRGSCRRIRAILAPLGASVIAVPIAKVLHLKSAVTALPDGTIIGYLPIVDDPRIYSRFLPVPEEPGSHVVLLGGDKLLMSAAAPQDRGPARRRGLPASPRRHQRVREARRLRESLAARIGAVTEAMTRSRQSIVVGGGRTLCFAEWVTRRASRCSACTERPGVG